MPIPLAEFAARRKKVATALRKSVAVVFAGEPRDHLHDTFRPHPHFEYLTGVVDEPGAVLVLDPGSPVAARREVLLLRPLDPELEKWDGLREELGAPLRRRTGFEVVLRLGQLPRLLNDAVQRSRDMACLHPLAAVDEPVSPDLALFRRLEERIPGATITDRTEVMAKLRAVKSRAEVAAIQQAIDATAAGFEAVFRTLRPGLSEFDVQETLEHAYRTNGSRGPAFGTIVGGGVNSTVLHYRANDRELEDGDVVCIDSGAACGGYGADITRTLPVNGTFSPRQREVYEIVLAAQLAAIKAARPGVRLADLNKAARGVIAKAGHGDHFIHGIGHHLGLQTHDITPDEPLREGAVITVEPGIYIADEKLGIRIEDDVLITKDGCRVLSAKIPKKVKDLEKKLKAES